MKYEVVKDKGKWMNISDTTTNWNDETNYDGDTDFQEGCLS